MAKLDFMPYRGTDQGNALPSPEWSRVGAGETYTIGEPVAINASGFLVESATNPGADDFAGFAATSGDTVGATDPIGTLRTPGGLFTPGAASNLPVTGDRVCFWRAKQHRKWITTNFSTGGVGVAVVPQLTNIGDVGGLRLNGGVWWFDTAAGTTKLGRITDIHNLAGNSILQEPATPGVFCIIEWATDQLNVVSDPLA